MIEINLLEKKKKKKIPKILGVDISEVNFKLIIICYILTLIPEYTIFPMWEDEIKSVEKELVGLQATQRKLTKFVADNKNVEERLKAYNKQIESLKKRSIQVDNIIRQRTNPKDLLEKIARGMPSDMWLSRLEINSDKVINMKGASISYKSIGDFIFMANNSKFYGDSLKLKNSETKPEVIHGTEYRFQRFEIEGVVETFDPWAEQ